MVWKLQNHEAEIQKLASENESIPFLYVDAEKLPESRKLAK
jgi:hypothetical protein